MPLDISVVQAAKEPAAVAVPVGTTGTVPRALGLSRAALTAAGFDGKPGQTLVIPAAAGATTIAVGVGDPSELTAATLRTAAAAAVRAAGSRASLATTLADLPGVDAETAACAVAEGALLAAYRFQQYKSTPKPDGLASLAMVTGAARRAAAERGAQRGVALGSAGCLARDLANTPAADLPARRIAERAAAIAAERGLEIEVFNRDQLIAMGCGGIVGVNHGSAEPPRVVRLSYRPSASKPKGHLALVGKGVMFDSGGLSLKPNDGMIWMKLDMSGAAAVLAAMSVLGSLHCPVTVTGWLMCTDNMPSGSAFKLGDVLRLRNGKTAEIHNTDAEGRLVLADGLALAAEQAPDAIVDIATLTGACMVALGKGMAGVMGSSDPLIDQIRVASAAADESVWQLPLEPTYRKLLDSYIADLKNVGGPHAGAILGGLFLREFVGDVPWAHLDIAGPMQADADDGWICRGATGYGARLLAELACAFTPPRRRSKR